MKILKAADYGIKPNKDITTELLELIEAAGRLMMKRQSALKRAHIFSAVTNVKNICSILPIQ